MAPDVGVDAGGASTTDPAAVLAGAMLPFGGYKGAAITLLVELLAGPMLGEQLSVEAAEHDIADGGPAHGGEFVLAMDRGAHERLAGVDRSRRAVVRRAHGAARCSPAR